MFHDIPERAGLRDVREKIMPGEKYSREVGKYYGDFFERDLHTECYDVLNDFLYENEENEFSYDEINYWWRETRCDNCKHHYPSCDSTCKAAGKGDSEKCDSYHENRRYDGIEEWYSEQQEKERKLRQILEAFLSRYDESGSTDVPDFVDSEMYDIMEELTKLAPPTPMKPLTIKQKWNALFRETGDLVKTSIEQYFCK